MQKINSRDIIFIGVIILLAGAILYLVPANAEAQNYIKRLEASGAEFQNNNIELKSQLERIRKQRDASLVEIENIEIRIAELTGAIRESETLVNESITNNNRITQDALRGLAAIRRARENLEKLSGYTGTAAARTRAFEAILQEIENQNSHSVGGRGGD